MSRAKHHNNWNQLTETERKKYPQYNPIHPTFSPLTEEISNPTLEYPTLESPLSSIRRPSGGAFAGRFVESEAEESARSHSILTNENLFKTSHEKN